MKKLLLFGILFVLLWACNKDDDPTKMSYYPLAVGNYWVYENYWIDKDGVESKALKADSLLISRDTVIRGQAYFVMESYNYSMGDTEIFEIRDSSGYIVRSDGKILFAENNFNDTLTITTIEDGASLICTTIYKMEKVSNKVTVPAGVFDVLNFKGTVSVPDPSLYEAVYPRCLNNYFAMNVGKILQTSVLLHSPDYLEKRLVRYHVND